MSGYGPSLDVPWRGFEDGLRWLHEPPASGVIALVLRGRWQGFEDGLRWLHAPPWPPEALCNDCLRAVPDAEGKHHTAEIPCPHCGCEDVCSCPDCLQVLEELRAGERDSRTLRLQGPDGPIEWSEEGGIR